MSQETDEAKLNAFTDSLKANLLGDVSIPIEVSEEKKALGEFESAQPFSETRTLEKKEEAPPNPQKAQEEADRLRFRRGYRKPSLDDSYVQELALSKRALEERLEYNAQFHQAELARLQAEVAKKEKIAQELEDHALKVKEEYLVSGLIQAKEAGNYAAEAKIQKALSAVHADLSTSDLRYKAQSQKDQSYAQPYNPPPPPQIEQQAPRRPEFEAWLESNPWFEPESPDYNPELVQEVMGHAANLNKHLQIRGLSEHIDSAEYYKVLDTFMKQKYDLRDQEDPQETRRTASLVAPVQRQASPPSGHVSVTGKSAIYLDADQREIALARKKTHANGTPYTPHELLQYHAQLVSRLQEHDKVYGIQPNQYKTTLKFG